MSLSRKAAKAQDHKIREQLKRMDNIAVALFFAIPLCLALIGGRQLAVWTLPGWYLYSLGYIISFRVVSKNSPPKRGRKLPDSPERILSTQSVGLFLLALAYFL